MKYHQLSLVGITSLKIIVTSNRTFYLRALALDFSDGID
jgi:hypothetical protein